MRKRGAAQSIEAPDRIHRRRYILVDSEEVAKDPLRVEKSRLEAVANDEVQIDEAWKCLFAAQRAEIPSLDKNEVEIKAAVLRREAEKLSSWRRHRIGRDSSDFTEFLRRKRSLQCHIQSGRS